MSFRVLAMCSLLLLVCPASTLAVDLFVNNQLGDDLNNGHSPEASSLGGPLKSIACALAQLPRSGRIILANTGEPYRESICISGRLRGTAERPLTIYGNGAILDGTVVAEYGAWKYQDGNTFAMRPRKLAYQQLFLDAEPLQRVQTASWAKQIPKLGTLQWALQDGKIYLAVEEGRLPYQYNLRYTGLETGVSLYNTEHLRIEDLVLQGFHVDGIHATDTVRHCQLRNVECRANGRCGICISGASRVEIIGALCYDNGRAQLRVEDYAKVALIDCNLDPNSPHPLDVRGGQVSVNGRPYQR